MLSPKNKMSSTNHVTSAATAAVAVSAAATSTMSNNDVNQHPGSSSLYLVLNEFLRRCNNQPNHENFKLFLEGNFTFEKGVTLNDYDFDSDTYYTEVVKKYKWVLKTGEVVVYKIAEFVNKGEYARDPLYYDCWRKINNLYVENGKHSIILHCICGYQMCDCYKDYHIDTEGLSMGIIAFKMSYCIFVEDMNNHVQPPFGLNASVDPAIFGANGKIDHKTDDWRLVIRK